jgi:hypothetical protein
MLLDSLVAHFVLGVGGWMAHQERLVAGLRKCPLRHNGWRKIPQVNTGKIHNILNGILFVLVGKLGFSRILAFSK